MNVAWISFVVFVSIVTRALAYSGGAPENVCDDMTPKHPAQPKKTGFPYVVTVNKKEIKSGDKVEITIDGGKEAKTFKGFLIQVRNADKKAVGSFSIADTDKYAKTINCHGTKQSAATHKNSTDKPKLTVQWIAPEKFQGVVNVYTTVAQDGEVFWVQQKQSEIKVIAA